MILSLKPLGLLKFLSGFPFILNGDGFGFWSFLAILNGLCFNVLAVSISVLKRSFLAWICIGS